MKPLNETEKAVARAFGCARAFGDRADKATRDLCESLVLVQLGRANKDFDYDMFAALVRDYEAKKRAEDNFD